MNGAGYTTPYPDGYTEGQDVYYADVTVVCTASSQGGGAGSGGGANPLVTGISVAGGKVLLTVKPTDGANPDTKSNGGGVRLYMSPTLPFPENLEPVALDDCIVTDNGDGTLTVELPVDGDKPSMFIKIAP